MTEKKKTWFNSGFIGILITCFLAILFRTLFFEPFHIPSGSMKPNLLVGDYVFVNKMSYGYSKYSIPFHPNFLTFNLFRRTPKRGDVVVFVPPKNQSVYYVKRVIGLPNDTIEIKNGILYVNNHAIQLKEDGEYSDKYMKTTTKFLEDNLEKKYNVIYIADGISLNDAKYTVPKDLLFVMGDNRDNSMDSRFRDEIGFIPINNLVGKVSIVGLSINEKENRLSGKDDDHFINKMKNLIRFNRILHIVK